MIQKLSDVVSRIPDKPALLVERNGKILKWTWMEYYNETISFAKALHAVGVTERKAINITGYNSPEWVISFLGSIANNCVVSGVYITNTAEACIYQADHSDAEVIVVDSIE